MDCIRRLPAVGQAPSDSWEDPVSQTDTSLGRAAIAITLAMSQGQTTCVLPECDCGPECRFELDKLGYGTRPHFDYTTGRLVTYVRVTWARQPDWDLQLRDV